MLSELVWIDYAILGIIGLSVLIGVWRGFMREVLSLAAWAAAFFVSFTFAASVADYLTDYVSVPSVRIIMAFGGLFLVTLLLGGLANILVAQMIQGTGLSGTDRMIGVIFGVLRGIAIIAVLVLLAGLTPVPQDPRGGISPCSCPIFSAWPCGCGTSCQPPSLSVLPFSKPL